MFTKIAIISQILFFLDRIILFLQIESNSLENVLGMLKSLFLRMLKKESTHLSNRIASTFILGGFQKRK